MLTAGQGKCGLFDESFFIAALSRVPIVQVLFAIIVSLVLWVPTANAGTCGSVHPSARIDIEANFDQSQPAETCSVRNLSESACRSLSGYRHYKRDRGSGFSECFFEAAAGPATRPAPAPVARQPIPPAESRSPPPRQVAPNNDNDQLFGDVPKSVLAAYERAVKQERKCADLANARAYDEAASCYTVAARLYEGTSDTVENEVRMKLLADRMRMAALQSRNSKSDGAGQHPQQPLAADNCVVLGKPRQISRYCDGVNPPPQYATSIRTNPKYCTSNVLVEYIDPHTKKVAQWDVGRKVDDLYTCGAGVTQVRIVRK